MKRNDHCLVDTWLDQVHLRVTGGTVSRCSEKAEGVLGPKRGAGRASGCMPSHAWLYSHVIKVGAGVDSDAETMCTCALRAQAVQYI